MIASKARRMTSKEDLLDLLNQIKLSEMDNEGLADQFHPFTMRQLNYYCNPRHAFHRYVQFMIPKRAGGYRQITSPRNPSFMLMLRCVNEMLKALYTPSAYAMGFTEGRSVVTNASLHVGQNYVFNTDLKDFFPSIHQARVWRRIQLEPLSLQPSVANLVAGLCAMRYKNEHGGERCVLPQGAPTSPILTNMICDKLDRRLAGLAKRFGLRYTRYADDITFSSMHNVYQADGPFRKELKRIIEDQGFTINEAKTRLQKRGARQEVTGLVVSDKVNVTQKYVRDLRNILYIWRKYGYDSAYNKFFARYKAEKNRVKKGNPDMVNVLDGKLMYLKMVKGETDSVYCRLKRMFDHLASLLSGLENTTCNGVKYIETTPVTEFEHKYNTTIVFAESKPKKQKPGQGPSTSSENTSLELHRYARFTFGDTKQLASLNKSLTLDELSHKEILSISHCRNAQGKLFWLIHRSDKKLTASVPQVDVDELNSELDALLLN